MFFDIRLAGIKVSTSLQANEFVKILSGKILRKSLLMRLNVKINPCQKR